MNMQIEAKWNEENKPSPIKEFDGKLLKTIDTKNHYIVNYYNLN